MAIYSFSSGSFSVTVYDTLDDELAHKWNESAPESLQSSYLKFIEDTRPLDLDFRYVLIETDTVNGKTICGIIYFQLLKFTKRNIRLHHSSFLNFLTQIALALRPVRLLTCGNLFAVNYPCIWFDTLQMTRDQMISIVCVIDKKEKNDVIILKDMDVSFTVEEMSAFGLRPYRADMTMELTLDSSWKSFEGYQKSLSKKYRKRAIKIRDAGFSVERRVINEDDIGKYLARIGELFEYVASKQTIRMGIIRNDYFYLYKKRFPSEFFMVGYFLDATMIGFSSYCDHGKILEMHYIGIDYQFNASYKLYFNMLFDGIEKAIELKKETLELGRTAREAKANLGGHPVYFSDFIRIKNRFTRFLVSRLTSYFQQDVGEEWKNRHPFKN